MIKIHGSSDDIVYIESTGNKDHCAWEDEVGPSKSILIGTTTAGVIIKMRYGAKVKGAVVGVWQASIHQLDEGSAIPWDVTVCNAPPSGSPDPQTYSVLVEVHCPPGTPACVGKHKLGE